VLETKDILHVCVQKFLVRERGKCWNWRTSRYVPTGTRRKERFICAFKREGEVLETEDVAQRIDVPTWRNRKKRKEKKRILRIYLVEDLYFILRI
jgi:hypothetical protein